MLPTEPADELDGREGEETGAPKGAAGASAPQAAVPAVGPPAGGPDGDGAEPARPPTEDPGDNRVVFVIDDHPGMRKSLQFLIETAGLKVEAYPTAQDFLDSYDPARCGCLVLDMRMPGMTGLELLDELANRGDSRPAIMITGFGSVPTAVRAMKAGAIDFLEKPFDDDELLERVQQGLQLDAVWRAWRNESIDIVGRLASLTPREREVLDLIVEGQRTREIAGRLGLSAATVADHRQRLMRKMNARTALDLVRMIATCRKSSPHQ